MSKDRKQKLAEALAEETAGIDIEALVGPPRKPPDTLSPEEQRSRDQAFVQRFTAIKAQPASAPPAVAISDTVSHPDTVSGSDTVAVPPAASTPATVPESATESASDTVSVLNTVHPAAKNTLLPRPGNRKRLTPLKSFPGDGQIAHILQRNGNQPAVLGSGYTAVLWSIDDVLARLQTPAEQTVYRHLYRLAYGFANTHCFVGYHALRQRSQMSTNPLRRALAGLAAKKHIAILETVNTKEVKGTVYRVFLPEEIKGVIKQSRRPEPDPPAEGSPGPTKTHDAPSEIDTVSDNDTGTNLPAVADPTGETLSQTDTARSRTDNPDRTESLEPTSVPKASYVRTLTERLKGLAQKTPKPQNGSDQDDNYIRTLPSSDQSDLFNAQETWQRWYPDIDLPNADKLNAWLQTIRDQRFEGERLDALFEEALRATREREPRDVIGWLTKGFRDGYLIDPGIFR